MDKYLHCTYMVLKMGEKTKKKFKLCVTNHMFYKIVLDDHNNYKIWQSYSSKVNFDCSSIFLDYSLSSRMELHDCFSQSWMVKWILQCSSYLSFQLIDIFKSLFPPNKPYSWLHPNLMGCSQEIGGHSSFLMNLRPNDSTR